VGFHSTVVRYGVNRPLKAKQKLLLMGSFLAPALLEDVVANAEQGDIDSMWL